MGKLMNPGKTWQIDRDAKDMGYPAGLGSLQGVPQISFEQGEVAMGIDEGFV
jgi:hypothetical protein